MTEGLWRRLRSLGTKVEDEIFEFTEEEEGELEPRGRNSLVALINAFLILWKANTATAFERVTGLLGLASLLWLIVGDRGLGIKKAPLRVVTGTLAALWFVPGLIASFATLSNLGFVNMRRPRMWPLLLVFSLGGLISFRAVFAELAQKRLRPRAVRRS